MIEECHVLEGGACWQILGLVDRRSWRLARFPARFLALKHSLHGWILVDTGYGAHFHEATRRFPQRLYRLATPVSGARSTGAVLKEAGIDAAKIRHVVLSHFHADHIGGLREFPDATIHFHAGALSPLLALPPLRQVRSAFLAGLVPDGLSTQSHKIPAEAFLSERDFPFKTHDLFGDGSLQLVDLPGHAPGHLGLRFECAGRRLLYAVDAFWRECQIQREITPLGLALHFQWHRAAYHATIEGLRTLSKQGGWEIAACHGENCLGPLSR